MEESIFILRHNLPFSVFELIAGLDMAVMRKITPRNCDKTIWKKNIFSSNSIQQYAILLIYAYIKEKPQKLTRSRQWTIAGFGNSRPKTQAWNLAPTAAILLQFQKF